MHGNHESSRLWCGNLSLIDRDHGDESSDPKSIDQTANHEHSVVDRAGADGSTDDQDDGCKLDGALSTELVGSPRTDRRTDGRSGTVDSIEGADVLGGFAIAWLALRGKI